jgi:hypothetical protein
MVSWRRSDGDNLMQVTGTPHHTGQSSSDKNPRRNKAQNIELKKAEK